MTTTFVTVTATGAGSGIGLALAKELDVTDSDAVAAVVGEAFERFGGVDVVVANAGVGAVGSG